MYAYTLRLTAAPLWDPWLSPQTSNYKFNTWQGKGPASGPV